VGPASGVSAGPGVNEVTLTWVNPSEGPSPEGVYVEVTGPQGFAKTVAIPGPATQGTVSGLRNGVTYSFRVTTATREGSAEPTGWVSAMPSTGVEGVVAGLIVEFTPGSEKAQGERDVPGEDKVQDVDLTVAEKVSDDSVLVELSEPVDVDTATRIADDLAADEEVAWAEPDQFLFTASEATTNNNDAATSAPVLGPTATDSSITTEWNLAGAYGVDAAFIENREDAGKDVTVSVIDTGITNHPDLQANLVDGYDFVSSPDKLAAVRQANAPPVAFDADYIDEATYGAIGRDANPADPGDWRETTPARDSSWHGTGMAGLISDVAPGASIQPVRALSWRGGLLSDIAASITWASGGAIDGVPANANPSKVINMSFAVEAMCPVALQDAIDGARERGSILVAAAGNASDDAAKFAPGNCNGVITVGSTTSEGTRADYSNYGPTIDISAPGGNTPTPVSVRSNTGTQAPDQPSTAGDFGTSVSASHVAAGAAILASTNPSITPDEAYTTLTGRDYVKAFANPTCDTANPDYTCGTGILTLAQIQTVASGDQDYAMTFNGPSDQAAVAASNAAFKPANALTLMAWVKPTNCSRTSTDHMIVMFNESYELSCRAGTYQFTLRTVDGTWGWNNTGIAPLLDQWQHVAVTRGIGVGTFSFYLNGQLAFTGGNLDGDIDYDDALNFSIGGDPAGSAHFFEGQIDEVRVYNTDRSNVSGVNMIPDDMHTYGPMNTTGLLSYYDFNEGPAGTTGTGTVYNRADGGTSATNLRTVNGPTYTDVKQTTSNGSNTVVTFPRSYLTAAGGWRVPEGVSSAETLVVAGGGGGGGGQDTSGWQGGGGGAGGYLSNASTALVSGSVVEVQIGQGGLGSVRRGGVVSPALNGVDSTFASVTADGGGSGGTNSAAGGNGGSGGGGGMYTGNGGLATSGQGNDGGNGAGSGRYAAGGGGGSASPGGAGTGSDRNAAGGSAGGGTANDISGVSVTYAAGGAGAGCSQDGSADAAGAVAVGESAMANTGSGGGGGGDAGGCDSRATDEDGGNGGSGVVIVSYSTANASCEPFDSSYINEGTVYRVLRWSDPSQSGCTWSPPSGVTAFDYLVVGGGGAGGSAGAGTSSGGGGGGQVIEGSVSAAGSSYSVTVGSGGSPVPVPTSSSSHEPGGDGEASSLGGISATGGGGGASAWIGPGEQGPASSTGWTGGGGAVHAQNESLGTTGTGGEGFEGGDPHGDGSAAAPQAAGGGGGSGGPGGNATAGAGGIGGLGVESSISGTAVNYAGGGGGGKRIDSSGSAGLGVAGGGNGGLGTSGTAGTLGGGGGGAGNDFLGGAGGDGVVIVRYEVSQADVCVPFEYSYVDETTNPDTPYTVVEFQGAGTCGWTPPTSVKEVDYLVVAGGGGGGVYPNNSAGGGGGAGGLATSLDPDSSSLDLGQLSGALTIEVGAGGAGGGATPSDGAAGANGSRSAISGTNVTTVDVEGGGGGAGNISNYQGKDGGSGGGALGSGSVSRSGGSATTGEGNDGGANAPGGTRPAGGGGGAGSAGDSGQASQSGHGGSGKFVSITGASIAYAGGGGGGDSGIGAAAGQGGGGGGGAGGTSGADGTDGLGGGGGGGGDSTSATGGDGGDGVVIVRYSNTPGAPTGLGATAGEEEVSLSWTAPTHSGASAISGYSVTVSSDGSNYSVAGAGSCSSAGTSTSTSCDVTGLDANTLYYFKVAAINASGTGTASSASTATPFGPVAQFAVTMSGGTTALSAAAKTVGTAFDVRVTAQDSNGLTNTAFTGTVTLSSTNAFDGTVAATISTSGYVDSVSLTPTIAGTNRTIAASGGSLTELDASGSFTVEGWSVTYDANATQFQTGVTSGSVPSETWYANGDTVTVASNTGSLARQGFELSGWNTTADGSGTSYALGSGTFTISADTTLYAEWSIPKAARLIGLTGNDAVSIKTVNESPDDSAGVRGLTTDGDSLYYLLGTGGTSIREVDFDGNWIADHTVSGLSTYTPYEQADLAHSSGCIFLRDIAHLGTQNDDLKCIDTSTWTVHSVTVPAANGTYLPISSGGWMTGNLIDFPDGRVGAVSNYNQSLADYSLGYSCPSGMSCKVLRLYSITGTGSGVALSFSEDIVLADDEASWPSDNHGIATDGTYLYQIHHQNGYKVWALRSGTPSYIVFNGDSGTSCAADAGDSPTKCLIAQGLGNATFMTRDHGGKRYAVGDYLTGKFYTTAGSTPPPGPGTTVPDAPTSVVATAGFSQATVTWDAPGSDGGADITGYTVTASPGGATCSPSNVATRECVVSSLATDGTSYTFTVVATNEVGDSVPSSASNSVAPFGAVSTSTSTVDATPTSLEANGSDTSTVTVTLKDASSNPVTTSGGTVTLSTDLGSLSAVTDNNNGTYTAVLTAGIVSGTATITAAIDTGSGAVDLSDDATVALNPGAPSRLVIDGLGSQTAGVAQGLTITAQDSYGNTATGYSGDKALTFSGASAAPDGTVPTVTDKDGNAIDFGDPTTITFSSGEATVSSGDNGAMVLYESGTSAVTIQVTDGTISAAGAHDLDVTVSAAALDSFVVTNTSSSDITSKTAGESFAVRVRAVDAFLNTDRTFTGTVDLSSTSTMIRGEGQTASFSTGLLSSATVALTSAGTRSVTATRSSGGSESGTSNTFTVDPGVGVAAVVTSQPVGGQSGASLPTQPQAQVQDFFGNEAIGASRTVSVTQESGTSWSLLSTSGYQSLKHVTYGVTAAGVGRWVGFNESDDSFYYSDSSETWTKVTGSAYSAVDSIAYGTDDAGDPVWMAVSRDPNNNRIRIMTSGDGASWTTVTMSGLPSDGINRALVYGNGVWMYSSRANSSASGDGIYRSEDAGASWTRVSTQTPYVITYGNGVWIAVRNSGSGTAASYRSTDNGITWVTGGTTTNAGYCGAFGNGVHFVMEYSGDYWLTTDGLSWSSGSTDLIDVSPGRCAFTGGMFVAASRNSSNKAVVATTATGDSWTSVSFTLNGSFNSLSSGGPIPLTGWSGNSSRLYSGAGGTTGLSGTTTSGLSSGSTGFTDVGFAGIVGTDYRLSMNAPGIAVGATTNAFSPASAGTASALATSVAVSGASSGVAFTTQPAIEITDSAGNRDTGDNSTVVTAAVSAGGTLVGTATATASSGVATFSDLGISGTAGAYTLTFSATGLSDVTQSVSVSAGAASALSITTAAGDTTYGTDFSPQPVITVQDSAGNTVTSWSTDLTATVKDSGGNTLETATATPSLGVATFSGLGSDADAGTVTVEYTSGALMLASETVLVSQAPVTVTASSPSVTYGDAVPTITPSYSGFVNGQSASVLGTAPTCTTAYTTTSNAGTTPATSCSGAVAANYSFSYTDGTVTIGQATPTISWSNASADYGDAAFTPTAPTVTGVTGASLAGTISYSSGDTSVVTVNSGTGEVTITGAGTSTMTASFTPTDSTNYASTSTTMTLTVTKAPLTITASSSAVTYGGAVPTISPAYSGFVNGQGVGALSSTPTCSTTYTNTSSVGTYPTTCSGAAGDDYSFVYVDGTVTVSAATPSLSWSNISKTYGNAPFSFTAPTATGVGGASLTGTWAYASSNTSVATVNDDVATIVGAGSSTITATFTPSSSNYDTNSIGVTLTVAKASQATLTMTSPSSAIHGETITLAASGGSGTGAVSFGIVAGTCTIDSGTTLTLRDAGSTCQVSATKLTDANYNTATSATQTITIAKAAQTLAFTSTVPTSPLPNGTYTPVVSSVSAVTGSSTGLTPSIAASGVCTESGGEVTFTATGTCTITASAAGPFTNFLAASPVTQVIVVGSLNQNITFAQPSNVSFGSSSVSMGASAVPSGLTVTYTLGAGTTNAACTVSSLGVVTVLAVGTCEVTASQAGDSQYAAASDVSRAFQVVPAKATAPTITSASASSQAITVGVAAPGFTGGVSITGYELVATPTGGGTAVTDTSCTSSPCTISGLVNGTEYTVTAAAINSAGTGDPSTASTPLKPATAAFAVGALAATPGDTTVTLTWVPLTTAQLGGGTFTRYEVNYRTAGSGSWTSFDNNVSGQSTSTILVTGLDNGTSYDFQVVAFTSANSTEIAGNTAQVVQYPSTVPSAPQSLATLAATATDVQFSWAPPLRDGGASVTGYTATVTSTSTGASTPITCTVTGTTPRCTASNLTNGAVYTFSVTAENRMGSSAAATKPYTVPSSDATLSELVVTGSAGAVSLSPSFAASTTGYTAEVGNGVESVTITPTTTDGGAQVTVDGVLVTSGEASESIALNVGSNLIEVEVTASDPRFTQMYEVTITRAAAPAPAPGPSPSDGGGSTPVDPLPVPVPVEDGEDVAVVMEGDEMVTVVLQPTAQQDGWEAVGSGFDMVVRTETPQGAPVPLANDRRLAVPQGGIVQAAGDGYMADSLVRVFMIPRTTGTEARGGVMPRSVSGAMFLGEATVDAAGDFAASFAVPLSVAIGDYVLQINGMAASAAVRSVNMGLMVEPGAAPMQAGMMQRAGFYQGLSDELSKSGERKMRALVESMPADAQAVQVLITGVSVSLESFEDNLALAGKRASKLAEEMKAAGVSGEYTVNVSSTFTVDAAERSLAGKADVLTTKTGKPLSTVTVLFQEPVSS